MPAPSVTNTFVNATTASATDVNQNFTDIINALTDGLKTITISALATATSTHSGLATFNGAVTLGSSSANAITLTGTMTSSTGIVITKTTNQLVLGTTNTTTINSTAPAASRVYTIPDAGTTASFVMTQGTQTIAGALTLSSTLTVSGTTTAVDIVSSGSINSLNMNTINYIMNGNLDIWQRGVSFAPATNGSYGADRWLYAFVGAGVVTVQRTADVPTIASTAVGSTYCLDVDVTAEDNSIAAGDLYGVQARIEGLVYQNIHSKQVTLSFWVKTTVTGIYCVSFRNSANLRAYVAEYTVNSTNTWEKKTTTITLDTSGTWLFTNGIGIRIGFIIACGSDFQITANTWTNVSATSSFAASSNQVNGMSSTSNNFKLSQVQLELGDQATPFKPFGGSYISDLIACQRYYYRITHTTAFSSFGTGQCISTTNGKIFTPIPTTMRSTPTLDASAASTLALANASDTRIETSSVSVNSFGTTPFSVTLDCVVASGLVAGNGTYLLGDNDAAAYVGFAAEL